MSEHRVTITYLEMTSPGDHVPFTGTPRLDVRRAEIPCPELNRFFYVAVGSDWSWHSRVGWPREQWEAYLARPDQETWIGYMKGTPVGYFELEQEPSEGVELVYFGLLPSFIGMGLGAEFLSAAIDRAWRLEPHRIWVHTCTLDHPRALPNYRGSGFRVYSEETRTEYLPDPPARFWSDSG